MKGQWQRSEWLFTIEGITVAGTAPDLHRIPFYDSLVCIMKGNHHLSGSKSRNSFLLHQGIFKKIVIYDIDLNILNNGIPLKCVNISKKLEAEVEKTVIKWNIQL